MALTAERHVHVGASDHALALLGGSAERERGVLLAEFADGRQLLDLLAQGNQLVDCLPGAAVKCALQRRDDHDLPRVGCLFRKLHQVAEKLALVNADDIELHPRVAQLRQILNGNRFPELPAVGGDHVGFTVAGVGGELDLEDFLASDFVLLNAAQ